MNILHTLPLPRSTWRLAALLTLLLAALTLSPTLVSANSPPQAPSSVTVTRADGTLTATWTAVAGAVGYHVTYSSDGKRSWTAAAANHPDTTITFSVNNSATYVVAARAHPAWIQRLAQLRAVRSVRATTHHPIRTPGALRQHGGHPHLV